MDHTYEEIRKVALDILSGRERVSYEPSQYEHLRIGVGEVFQRREQPAVHGHFGGPTATLSKKDSEFFLEAFWDLFRQGIITLGMNDSNRQFPFFRVSENGRRIIENSEEYFFHDVSTYEKVILENIPNINPSTLVYLKEAMQSFSSGCVLSSTVMIGVAIEHSFLQLLDIIEQNDTYGVIFKNVFEQRTILQKLNKFRNVLEQNASKLSPEIKEDLDTNFSGIITMIRNFRNESGHPSGKIISREQCYVLLQLFIPCCKKIYQLISFFK